MNLGLMTYVKAAFNARPAGMFVAPNWVMLAAFALVGWVVPGVWLVGAGVELLYLFVLSSNRRFQNVVNGQHLLTERNDWEQKLRRTLANLPGEDQRRYQLIERRSQMILERAKASDASPELLTQAEGLGRLLWIYLRLLTTRQQLARLLRDADSVDDPLDTRLRDLEKRLASPTIGEDLRRSLTGQMDILQQRRQSRVEAREKLSFVESELTRIQEQIELIREQSVLTEDPHVVSEKIDQIGAGLSQTSQWIKDQQRVLGQVDDLLDAPPPLTIESVRISQ